MSFCPFTLYINAAAYGFIFRRNCKNKSCSEPLSKYKSAFTCSKDHKLEKNENMVPFLNLNELTELFNSENSTPVWCFFKNDHRTSNQLFRDALLLVTELYGMP